MILFANVYNIYYLCNTGKNYIYYNNINNKKKCPLRTLYKSILINIIFYYSQRLLLNYYIQYVTRILLYI